MDNFHEETACKKVFFERPAETAAAADIYSPAPEAEDVARRVIECHHPHLIDAKITYIFRTDRWQLKDRPVLGKVVIAPQMWRYLGSCDLVLVINEVIFKSLSDEGRIAMLDNVLAQINPPHINRQGLAVWSTRDHDIREFSEVVKRHNICMSNLKAVIDGGLEQLDFVQTLADTVQDKEAVAEVYNKVTEVDEEIMGCEDYEELEEH